MQTEQINHDPAHTFMNTGTSISWPPEHGLLAPGTASEARRSDLPGFVVMVSVGESGQDQPISIASVVESGFLAESSYQGVQFHSKGEPVLLS